MYCMQDIAIFVPRPSASWLHLSVSGAPWKPRKSEEKRWTDFRWRSVLLSNYYSMLVGYVNVCEYFTKNQLSRLFLNFPFFFPHLLQFFGVIEVQINKFKSIPKRKRVHISKQRPWCERIWGDLASGVLHSEHSNSRGSLIFFRFENRSFALGKVMQRYMFRKKVWICFVQVRHPFFEMP